MPPFPRAARALALVLATLAWISPAPAETVITAADDPRMAEAIETAQSHLARVVELGIDADGQGHPALTLKVAFPVEGGEEIIWVAGVSRKGTEWTGSLANEPLHLTGLAAGDTVTFDQGMIADWGLVDASGKLFGHFTTRVLLETMPEDQAAPIRALLSEDPLPASWR